VVQKHNVLAVRVRRQERLSRKSKLFIPYGRFASSVHFAAGLQGTEDKKNLNRFGKFRFLQNIDLWFRKDSVLAEKVPSFRRRADREFTLQLAYLKQSHVPHPRSSTIYGCWNCSQFPQIDNEIAFEHHQ